MPLRVTAGVLALVFGLAAEASPQSPPAADCSALPELARTGRWADAQAVVDSVLTAEPRHAEGLRWQHDIPLIDSWPAVHVRGNGVYAGEFWLRARWVGFTPASPAEAAGAFVLPLGALELKSKEHTDWDRPGFGTVTYGIDIGSGRERYRIVTRDSFFEALSMHHRVRSAQVKSLQPFQPPADVRAEIEGRDAAQVKQTLEGMIRDGRWTEAEVALKTLAEKAPDDPDLIRLRAETIVLHTWDVRTWSPSDGWAGKLYLRRSWITLVGEDFGSDPKKPLRNESFHFPLTACRKVDVCSERDYGAKSGAPLLATDVVTGKLWGFELQFDAGSGRTLESKLILRPEVRRKDEAKAQAETIEAAVDAAAQRRRGN